MDIAIENDQNEVIRVLLEDSQWKRLIHHEPKTPKKKNTIIDATVRRLSLKPKSPKKSKVIHKNF